MDWMSVDERDEGQQDGVLVSGPYTKNVSSSVAEMQSVCSLRVALKSRFDAGAEGGVQVAWVGSFPPPQYRFSRG